MLRYELSNALQCVDRKLHNNECDLIYRLEEVAIIHMIYLQASIMQCVSLIAVKRHCPDISSRWSSPMNVEIMFNRLYLIEHKSQCFAKISSKHNICRFAYASIKGNARAYLNLLRGEIPNINRARSNECLRSPSSANLFSSRQSPQSANWSERWIASNRIKWMWKDAWWLCLVNGKRFSTHRSTRVAIEKCFSLYFHKTSTVANISRTFRQRERC